jgi:hypothetical protein
MAEVREFIFRVKTALEVLNDFGDLSVVLVGDEVRHRISFGQKKYARAQLRPGVGDY